MSDSGKKTNRTEERARLRYLIRKNAGKRILGNYVRDYAVLFDPAGGRPALLSLEQTDQLLEHWRYLISAAHSGERPGYKQRFQLDPVMRLDSFLTCMAESIQPEPVAVIGPYAENCGALPSVTSIVIRHALKILPAGNDAVGFIALNGSQAFSLDKYLDQPDGDFYELVVVGYSWPELARICEGAV